MRIATTLAGVNQIQRRQLQLVQSQLFGFQDRRGGWVKPLDYQPNSRRIAQQFARPLIQIRFGVGAKPYDRRFPTTGRLGDSREERYHSMRQCSTGSGRLHHGQLWRRRLAAGYRVDSCGRAQWVPLYCMMNTLRDEGIADTIDSLVQPGNSFVDRFRRDREIIDPVRRQTVLRLQLLQAADPDERGGHARIAQRPGERQLREGLPALLRDSVQRPDLLHRRVGDQLRRERAVPARPRALGNAVEVLVGQHPLRER